jgi:plastocyanin
MILVPALWVGLTAGSWAADEWGDLTVTFLYDGDAPKADPLKITRDNEFCAKFKVVDESLVVNPKNKGLANVIGFLYVARGGTKPPVHPSFAATADAKVKFDNDHCRFAPHVLPVRTSQTLVIGNSDAIGHNAKVDTFKNPPFNYTIPANGELEHRFEVEEQRPTRVSCSIHPWMSAWLLIRDNPYMAASDENGKLTVKNLPVGTWTFQFWQERAGYVSQGTQNGKKLAWPKGRVDVEIKPGANSLGEIRLPPTLFAQAAAAVTEEPK